MSETAVTRVGERAGTRERILRAAAELLAEGGREAILAAVTTDGSDGEATEGDGRDRAANRAVALKAVLSEAEAGLTPGERALLSEWLDTIADPAR